jgi:hypothetical protein
MNACQIYRSQKTLNLRSHFEHLWFWINLVLRINKSCGVLMWKKNHNASIMSIISIMFSSTKEYIQWNFSKPASTGTKNYGWFRGMASFMRLPLQRNAQQGLKKSADIQGGPVFWGADFEKFHFICYLLYCIKGLFSPFFISKQFHPILNSSRRSCVKRVINLSH